MSKYKFLSLEEITNYNQLSEEELIQAAIKHNSKIQETKFNLKNDTKINEMVDVLKKLKASYIDVIKYSSENLDCILKSLDDIRKNKELKN